jgi:hypothetical protein
MPALIATGSFGHALTTAANSGSSGASRAASAPLSAPPCDPSCDFPLEIAACSNPVPATSTEVPLKQRFSLPDEMGRKSVGVKRQYSGAAGRIENCQIGTGRSRSWRTSAMRSSNSSRGKSRHSSAQRALSSRSTSYSGWACPDPTLTRRNPTSTRSAGPLPVFSDFGQR